MLHNRFFSAFIKRPFTTGTVLFFLMGFASPAMAQLDGAYYDNSSYFHVFTEDGVYQVYDIENENVETGSYGLRNDVLRLYDSDDKLVLKVDMTQTRTGMVWSTDGETYRLKYVCTAAEFASFLLLGLVGSLIDR